MVRIQNYYIGVARLKTYKKEGEENEIISLNVLVV
jgi:hypothetical protein